MDEPADERVTRADRADHGPSGAGQNQVSVPSLNAAPWLPALTTACLAPRATKRLRRPVARWTTSSPSGSTPSIAGPNTSVSASARLGLTTSGCAVSALARTSPVESTTLRRPAWRAAATTRA